MNIQKQTIDGNMAAAYIAYAFSEVAAIYPITPSSSMGELADVWSAKGKENMFGAVPRVVEMQSEAGAAGAVHGSLTSGAFTTTFTASQGLLLMIPNMYKIAGELLPTVFHVASRSLAAQSLSIFGDHQDVMAARATGFGMLASANVQEVHDMAIVAHLATLESKVPFVHFFEGFRVSHEIQNIETVDYESLKELIDWNYIKDFKNRSMRPEKPSAKVGAENPDVYFQGREAVNKYYDAIPEIIKKYFAVIGDKLGREYKLFEYVGDRDAENIIVIMGAGSDAVEETVNYLNSQGQKLGAVRVRLYRPFSVSDFVQEIPQTVKKIAVLDRTKEPGSVGEPLYLDVVAALKNSGKEIIGGRFGLSSKEFTPSMIKAVYDHLASANTHDFSVGINDDVTHRSLEVKEEIHPNEDKIISAKIWGFGSDGSVGASKGIVKFVGDSTEKYAQGYFEYDSKKAGGVTKSHLRFSDEVIKSPYLVSKAEYVGLHHPAYIGRYNVLEDIREEGIFVLNTHFSAEEVFNHLTEKMQRVIIDKKIKFFIIDAFKIAEEVGLGNKISTVMQTTFFLKTKLIEEEKVLDMIRKAIQKNFGRKGEEVVKMNLDCVERARNELQEAIIPQEISVSVPEIDITCPSAGEFACSVVQPSLKLNGDSIPVSAMTEDGSVPTDTMKLEKRSIATHVPEWHSERCIQCAQCSFVCPHAAIRVKQIHQEDLKNAPATFKTIKSATKNDEDLQFKVQVYPEDCTGCGVCVDVCPAKEKAILMEPLETEVDKGEIENVEYFDNLPNNVTNGMPVNTVKGSQFKESLFEFHGACAGCGESNYIRLLTQLYGDRMIIANATGCSSIYGGTFPTIPYSQTKDGRGPVWANSLFEDNAEYGYGMKLGVDVHRKKLVGVLDEIRNTEGTDPEIVEKCHKFFEADYKKDVVGLIELRDQFREIKDSNPDNAKIQEIEIDYIIPKSMWIIGGDGWAYDIGYGGLDHVLSRGENVNILVLDTEVYSNTGGQASKATPLGATAKFATAGKDRAKKNMGMAIIKGYSDVYVAQVAMGANKMQLLKAFKEAADYDGPSIILAYSPCIEHGIDMSKSQEVQKMAVESGYWPIYRYNPALKAEGKNPFEFDAGDPKIPFKDYLNFANRYKTLERDNPERAVELFARAEQEAIARWQAFRDLI